MMRLATLIGAGLLAGGAVAGPASGQSILHPASESARRVNDLWWLMFWLGTVIFVSVMLLLLYAVSRGRRSKEDAPSTMDAANRW
jgi:heme/copper-type cytochrome/quinol oxidase subunit 2